MKQPSEKLQKVLAQAGLGSRREMEQWIEEGRIQVNRAQAYLGQRVSSKDQILVDGKPLKKASRDVTPRVILYHKPEGEVCSRKPVQSRPTVFDRLPRLKTGRWISVGRLDINTSGLLLLTTEGELANRLMHPSSDIEREYAVRVYGDVTNATLKRLMAGVQLEDGFARFEVIEYAGGERRNQWYHVIVKTGRHRLVRRLWESQGVQVSRLIRVRFWEFVLPPYLKQGEWIELSKFEVRQLLSKFRLNGNHRAR